MANPTGGSEHGLNYFVRRLRTSNGKASAAYKKMDTNKDGAINLYEINLADQKGNKLAGSLLHSKRAYDKLTKGDDRFGINDVNGYA
jgi:hypothetical protein